MKLTDIATLEKWIELEQKINARSGLNAAVFNVAGARITDFKRWANRLCPVIKADEKGQRRAVIAECDAGLTKIAVPIFINGEFLGVAGGCGYMTEDGEVDLFMINKSTGIANEKLIRLSDDIPIMTKQQAESLVRFIEDEVHQIIKEYENRN